MTRVWDVSTVDPTTLTYVQEGTGISDLPAYQFVAGVIDCLMPADHGPFGTTGKFLDVAVEDEHNVIGEGGLNTQLVARITTSEANPAGIGIGLHFQFSGGGSLYIGAFPGFSADGSDVFGFEPGCGLLLQSAHGLEWNAGWTEEESVTDPTNVFARPGWVRLLVDESSLVVTAELWSTDPALGGSPVVSAGPYDFGVTPAELSGATAFFVSRIDPGISVPVNNELKIDQWYVDQGPLAPPTGADSITCSASPDAIVADGNQQSDLTATVLDTDGNPLAGETVVFTADSATAGAAGTCGPTTDHHDGIYTAKYTDTTTAGDVTITATDGSLSATCIIHQTPTVNGHMGFGPPQVGIVRQGRS